MGKAIGRRELHEAVCAQPMSVLAKEFGVSDVALAKACRKIEVPVPPRGYWARKAAGERVIPITLTPRPPVVGGEDDRWRWTYSEYQWRVVDEDYLEPVPPPPVFDEPLEDVRARIETAIGRAPAAQKNLTQPHPVVAGLLEQDQECKSCRESAHAHLHWT